ncbi:MAG: hypothetical protein ACLFUA_06115 [Spirochaetales bacterium]
MAITNFQAHSSCCITLTLAGPVELTTMLEYSPFEPLRACARLSNTLLPMTVQDTIGYIDRGLALVNYASSLFSETTNMPSLAPHRRYRRAVNTICNRAILGGAIEKERSWTPPIFLWIPADLARLRSSPVRLPVVIPRQLRRAEAGKHG